MKSYEALSARVHASLTLIHTSSLGKLQVLKCLTSWPHSCTCIVRAIYSPVSFGHLPELFNNHLWSQEETISRVKLGCMPSSKGASFALSWVGTAQPTCLPSISSQQPRPRSCLASFGTRTGDGRAAPAPKLRAAGRHQGRLLWSRRRS